MIWPWIAAGWCARIWGTPGRGSVLWFAPMWCAAAVLLSSCGAPPLTLYTLGTPDTLGTSATSPATAALGKKPLAVVAVARVTVPDELDTEDIVIRDGTTLQRSRTGRWASRLSLGVTDRLTQRLAGRRPNLLITDRPLTDTPTYRVLVNIARLDVSAPGVATLDADWMVVPRDQAAPTRRDRGHFTATGSVVNDRDVVSLMGAVLDQLAGAIAIGGR